MRGRLKVFFDGGCRGRDGRLELAVVAAGQTTIVADAGFGTSSDAEWLAAIQALTIARAMAADDFVLIGDSADVVAKAGGKIACRGADARHLTRFRALADGVSVRVRHVKRSQNLAGIALARHHAQ